MSPPLAIGVPLGVGHQANYFFQFDTQAQAMLDPVAGPKLFTAGGLQQPNVVFPVNIVGPTGSLPGWWCCITEPYPIDTALLNHPNLQFALDRQAMFGSDSAILANRMGDGSQFIGPN